MIAFDLDGVLCDTIPAVREHVARELGMNAREFLQGSYSQVFDHPEWDEKTRERVRTTTYAAFANPDVVRQGNLIKDGEKALMLGMLKGLVTGIITRRPAAVERATRDWVFEHFGDVPVIRMTDGCKSEHMRLQGATVIVEDSLSEVAKITDSGLRAVLIDAPYNQGPLPKGATRAKGYLEALLQCVDALGETQVVGAL